MAAHRALWLSPCKGPFRPKNKQKQAAGDNAKHQVLKVQREIHLTRRAGRCQEVHGIEVSIDRGGIDRGGTSWTQKATIIHQRGTEKVEAIGLFHPMISWSSPAPAAQASADKVRLLGVLSPVEVKRIYAA